MRSVAAEAAVSERTIYRYFENLETLRDAVRRYVASRGGVPVPDASEELEGYAKHLFDTFEANSELIVGLVALATNSLRAEFTESRSKNLDDLKCLLTKDFPDAPEEERHAAAISLRGLLSGGNWAYLRMSCGLPQEEIVRSAQWAIRRALDHLHDN
jgi:AcrR family transcriptional regulator